jgi:glycine dehydrogenase
MLRRVSIRFTNWDARECWQSNKFFRRHVGPSKQDVAAMLKVVNTDNLDTFIDTVVPQSLRYTPEDFAPRTEAEALSDLENTMGKNKVLKSCIGQGFYETVMPSVIQRNLLESPGWYTPYTPYQAEIAQGRLESLLNYQTMVIELTKMDVCNASLLDEATAAAEAMTMCSLIHTRDTKRKTFIVSSMCHPSTIELVKTRALPFGITIIVAKAEELLTVDYKTATGVLLQYPETLGAIPGNIQAVIDRVKSQGSTVVMATDLLAVTLIKPPGELKADIVVGSSQRFGVPMGYGGPNAAFLATTDVLKRNMPGRIIGVSKDVRGERAIRMALQTREQHIRRERATSNICTAQALLANIAAMYGVYHGPEGLKDIARKVHESARAFYKAVSPLGVVSSNAAFFDTVALTFPSGKAKEYHAACVQAGINVRLVNDTTCAVSFDETTTSEHVETLVKAAFSVLPGASKKTANDAPSFESTFKRSTTFMTQSVFNKYHSETAMMRYIYSLQRKDLGLNVAMIPLGSCTMKLNAASEMIPMTWKSINGLHPYCPLDQAQGYADMMSVLKKRLATLMGFDDVCLQPNSGSQGEYCGLRTILSYHTSRGESHRKTCFILQSAHGTNPATAAMCGMDIVVIKCKDDGSTDMDHLKTCIEEHGKNLAALMITYPSTYGIFEPEVKTICDLVHAAGGQVYIDGANLNAMLGHTAPGFIGGDVAHTNLHKTFSIPHGGGGPGVGPIGVKKHLIPFLPTEPKAFGSVSQTPYGSASILNISSIYISMMGKEGLTMATKLAILNANYLMERLKPHYPVLYTAANGTCAHEFILDLRGFKATSGIEAEDVAKRLMDYNLHAPTLSFPVANTLMVEPTESEPLSELDRFVDAMIRIRQEIRDVETGKQPKENNVLKNAPHVQDVLTMETWDRPYSRELAVFPTAEVRANKFWPTVSRIDGAYGDRNFSCMCEAPLPKA